MASGRQTGMQNEAGTRQHSIPKFYQRGFIQDKSGLIWVYEKDAEPRQESVRKTGMEIDFYGFTKNGQFDNKSVENELQKVDHMGARLIHTLEKGKSLSDQERYQLSQFVSVMWRRRKKHKFEAEHNAASMMPNFFEQHDEEWLVNRLEKQGVQPGDGAHPFEQQRITLAKVRSDYLKNVPDFLFARNVVRNSMFEEVLYAMDWVYFQSTEDTNFLTCDNPVAFNKGTGLKDRDAVIIFPLSRKLLLQAMWISNYRASFVRLSDAQIRTINKYVVQNAHQQVYASKRSRVIRDFVSKRIGTLATRKASHRTASSQSQ
jgi:hypothetical protein